MHFTEYDTRVAAYAAILERDHILLTWYNGLGGRTACWTLPGGGVELDEQCEEAVVREVLEETGHTIRLGRVITTASVVRREPGRERPFKAVRIIYAAQITGGHLGTTEVDGSTDRAEWVALTDVDGMTPRADVIDHTLAALGIEPGPARPERLEAHAPPGITRGATTR
ncbi:NUDIX domain-containing protein [Arsenicicoccus sp. oral taxon 190]|uniref:NUDIX domain-containing protein n=1 Tax=Arsenicicoccus sp. oral taxon 190 TaxID=1658671 RepID=UPI0009E3F4C2|nr:NUDIX domain-containing protein [Arsenicicoccus sp. oral taxon 190]